MTRGGVELLLDTHAWIWFAAGERLGRRHVRMIEQAAGQGRLRIAAISVWEVALLEAHDRIRLGVDVTVWVERALALPGLSIVPLTPAIAVESTRLPGSFHADPADRMLVATARLTAATLMSADRRILDYAEAGFVRVIAL